MFPLIVLVLSLLTVPQPKVILVTIDGVMWQDIYGNNSKLLVPNLYNDFVEQGIAVGKLSPMIASGPMHISLPGYLEITRGHPSTDCQRNDCSPRIDRTVFKFFHNPAAFSSWKTVERTIPSNLNIYHDNGPGYRDDVDTEVVVNQYLLHNTPDFLWVSLGDTDEWAHANDRFHYLEALAGADRYIHSLVQRYPDSTFIVTTDHGRNRDFKDHGFGSDSERVWLMMRGPKVPHKGLVKAQPLSLSNIYYTIMDSQIGSSSPYSILSRIQ